MEFKGSFDRVPVQSLCSALHRYVSHRRTFDDPCPVFGDKVQRLGVISGVEFGSSLLRVLEGFVGVSDFQTQHLWKKRRHPNRSLQSPSEPEHRKELNGEEPDA